MSRRKINRSDAILLAIMVFTAILALKASEDPLPAALRGTWLGSLLQQFTTGNQLVFDLTVGFFSAIATYFLFVRLPEQQKRKRIVRQLSSTLRDVKLNCIRTYLSMLRDGSYEADLPEQLLDQETFKAFFHANKGPGQSRWGHLTNELNEYWFTQILVELRVLREEIQFALAALEPRSDSAFERLKDLYGWAVRAEAIDLSSDDTKGFFRSLWSMHTGCSFMDGYTGRDHVADQIASL